MWKEESMEQKELTHLAQAVLGQIFIELEASGRHVHVTKEQAQTLFGHDLTPERPLSQPGQFLAKERVSILGPKGKFHNVAVLGPVRKEGQVEISLTDGRILGINPPIRPSGDIAGSPGILLTTENSTVALPQGVIVAQRHLHLTPQTARRFGVTDKQTVKIQTFTDRPVIFEDVLVRVSPDFADRVHLDYDEANACGLQKEDLGRILL
jgi:propanediol utilization protein